METDELGWSSVEEKVGEVRAACAALLRQRKRPTVQSVRSLIGKGSPAFINREITAFFANLQGDEEHLDLPPSLLAPIRQLVTQVQRHVDAEGAERLGAALDEAKRQEEFAAAYRLQILERDRKIVELELEVTHAKENLESIVAASSKLRIEINAAHSVEAEMRTALASQMARFQAVSEECHQRAIEASVGRTQLEHANAKLEQRATEIAEMRAELNQAARERDAAVKDNERLKELAENSETASHQMQREIERVTGQNEVLRAELAHCRQQK